jgi:hypoxanthine phosphoribosyltransferase
MIVRPDAATLFDYADISLALDTMAATLNSRCAGNEWLVLCVMNGALMFTGELLGRLDFALKLDQVKVSRYLETTTGETLQWQVKPSTELAGRRILLLDDIFDEGVTLSTLATFCESQGAREVVSAVLVDKHHDRRQTDYAPDVIGLACPDRYIFGFGMDYEGYWRNSRAIYALPDDNTEVK